jgi:hypothetical protein
LPDSLPKVIPELLDRQAGISHKAAYGVGVDRVVPRDRDDAYSVRHDDVLALPDEAEPGFLEGPDRIEMGDAGKPGYA